MNNKVCSKAFLIGEYSITKENHSAIILKVDKYTYADIEFSNEYYIKSDIFDYSINSINIKDEKYQVIIDSICGVNRYLKELKIDIKKIKLDIKSELFNNGNKYGLGSSGAIIVLIVKSMLKLYNLPFDKLLLFKLSAIIAKTRNDIGSYADIATISFDNNIYYRNFNKNFITIDKSITSLLKDDWNYLKIEEINLNLKSTLLIIYSGVSISNNLMLKNIDIKDDFYIKNEGLTLAIKNDIEKNNIENFKKNIIKARILLNELSNKIEILQLQEIIENSFKTGNIAKTSGAGGGDCAIVFSFDQKNLNNFKNINKYKIVEEKKYE